MNLYPKNALEKFEFASIRKWLSGNCISPMGKEIVAGLHPYSSFRNIKQHLALTQEIGDLIENHSNFPIDGYLQVSNYLNLLEKEGYTAQPEQISGIRETTKTVEQLRKFIKSKESDEVELLKKLVFSVEFEKKIITIIDKVLTSDALVKDSASGVLRVIREEYSKTKRLLEKEFNKSLVQYRNMNYLAPMQESVRHGRRVLAVKAEYKRKINGVIHDISETGQTAYVEPNNALQLSNELLNLEQEERAEIHRILRQLTADVRPFLPLVKQYEDLLGKIDFTRAKAILAKKLDAVVPEFVDYPVIDLKEAYHPTLKIQNEEQKKHTQPLNVHLNGEKRILVISGPNAGGKSVSLKTIGILQIMIQSGIPIPVDESSKMGMFQQLFSEIGDDQSIENELSTYSSKLEHMNYFIRNIDENSLFLIDEFGSGTDPSLGGAVAQAILEDLNEKKAFGVITTHYFNLKTFANETEGVENGAMLFDEETLRPMYQLEPGKPGSSYTFAIAQTSGLPKPIVDRAKNITNNDRLELDNLLTDAQQSQSDMLIQKLELENRVRELEAKEKEFDRLKKKVKNERESYQIHKKDEELRIQNEVKKQFDQYVKKLENVSNQQKGIQTIRESLKNELETKKNLLHDKLRKKKKSKNSNKKIDVGSKVKWILNDQEGEVIEIKNKKAEVAIGTLRTTIPLKDLVHSGEEQTKKQKRTISASGHKTSRNEQFDFEIDIRGKRYEEAEIILHDFFDRAILTNSSWLRVLHGKGGGTLRKLTKEIAREYNALEVSHPHPEEGGDGISIVKF